MNVCGGVEGTASISLSLSPRVLCPHILGHSITDQDFELYPTINLRSRSFNVLQAPREPFIQALNHNLNLQRHKVIYICGNYSSILSKLDRRVEALEIRRAFTVFQFMTVLEEADIRLFSSSTIRYSTRTPPRWSNTSSVP
jgi:hypothetical protein